MIKQWLNNTGRFSPGQVLFLRGTEIFGNGTNERQAELNRIQEEAIMAIKIEKPSVIESAGNKPKRIEEYVGRVNSGTSAVSVARMVSPAGWVEPGQRPEFSEYTLVLEGMLRVKTETGEWDIHAGEAVITEAGEWVQYGTPGDAGAEYVAVCLPAFSPETVHRDDEPDAS